MKKKKILLIVLIILFILFATSSLAQIYDNYLDNNQQITIAGIDFKITYDSEKKELILDSNKGTMIIPQGDSRTLENNIYKFIDVSNNKYHLIVEEYKATAYIERTIKTTTLFPGNPAEIEVIIKNQGDNAIKAISFTQELKNNLFKANNEYKIIKNNEEQIKNTTTTDFIKWDGELAPQEEMKILYQVIPLTTGENNRLELEPAKISYEEAGLTIELDSETQIIKTKDIVSSSIEFINATEAKSNNKNNTEYSITTEPNYLKIGTTTTYTIRLTNNYQTTIAIQDLQIIIPEGITVIEKDNSLIKKNGMLIWDGKINENESKEFAITIKGEKRINANMTLQFKTPLSETIINNSYSKSIIYDITKLEPVITLNKEELNSNDKLIARITLLNPDEAAFFDFNANLTTDFYFKNISYTTLPNKKEILITEETIILPFTDTKKTFMIDFSGSYTTAGNEIILFSKQKEFSINPIEYDKVYAMDYLYYKLSNDSTQGYIFAKIDLQNLLKEMSFLRITTTYKNKLNQEQRISSFFSTEETAKISEKRPAGQLIIFPMENLSNAPSDNFTYNTELQYMTKEQYYYQDLETTSTINQLIEKIKKSQETNYFDIGRFYAKEDAFQKLLKEESIKTYEEKTVSTQNTAIIIGLIVIVIIAIIIANYISKKRAKSKYKFNTSLLLKKDAATDIFKAPKPTYDYAILQKYISFCKQNNLAKSKIRQNLIKQGWLTQIIDEFLK